MKGEVKSRKITQEGQKEDTNPKIPLILGALDPSL